MKEKLWTREFIVLSVISFFMYLVFYGILVVVAIHAMHHLSATTSEAGMAARDFLLAALFARLFAGHSIESFGKRRMMLWGLFFYAVIQGLYFFTTKIYFFIGIRFLHGLSFGFCATAISTLAAHLVPKARQSEGMGYFLLSTTLASAVGPFLGIYIYQNAGFVDLLLWGTILSSLAFALAFYIPGLESEAGQKEESHSGFVWQDYFEGKVLPIAFISFVIYFCYSGLISFFSAYALHLHMMQEGQYFFLIYSLAIIFSRPEIGRLADSKGMGAVMYPSFAAFAIGLCILGFLHTFWMMFAAAVLCGFGFGTFAAMGQVLAIQRVSKERIGIALSTLLAISELGTGIGPFILGGFIDWAGFSGLYFGLSILTVFSGMMYYVCDQRRNI